MMNTIVNISGYKFFPLRDLSKLQQSLKQHCQAIKLKGTILLSSEGININLAGEQDAIASFKQYLVNQPSLNDIFFKESYSTEPPFRKLQVKIKNEIIRFDRIGVDEQENKHNTISPQELKHWLDAGEPVTLVDTRNNYETHMGSFTDAITFDIKFFTELPTAIKQLPEQKKDTPLVVFCTGGVRCEKVLPLMHEQGFTKVYQLEGGILNYFAHCGKAYYSGECFVFDERIALNSELEQTGAVLCTNCQWPVTQTEQQSEHYQKDKFCPHCE